MDFGVHVEKGGGGKMGEKRGEIFWGGNGGRNKGWRYEMRDVEKDEYGKDLGMMKRRCGGS